MEPVETKVCTKCKKILPISRFHKDRHHKDGRRYECKDCRKEYEQTPERRLKTSEYCRRPEVKKRRAKLEKIRQSKPEVKEKLKERLKLYEQKPKRKKYKAEWQKKYSQRPEVRERRKKRDQKPEIRKHIRKKNREYYHKSEKLKIRRKDWIKNNPEKVRKCYRIKKAKRREMGYIELWSNPFPEDIEVEYHHIFQGQPFVIPIPKLTHQSVGGTRADREHWTFNEDWINRIYQIDVSELIQSEEIGRAS